MSNYIKNERKRISWTKLYFDVAKLTAERSRDPNTQVGAVIVKDKAIVSVGYNALPRNSTLDVDYHSQAKYIYIVHAELNAIANAARNQVDINGAHMYLTLSPCTNCINMLIQHGISKVYYLKEYPDIDIVKKIAKNANVYIEKVTYEHLE